MNVLLTGRPGIGKTTLIKKVIDMTSLSKGGFYTEEIREAGQRVGFSLTTLDGRKSMLAGLKIEVNGDYPIYIAEHQTKQEIRKK
ncbi:hypothetical protein ES708_15830 [subsurface metagenome]